jgi:NADPH:quinone reductase-like Zn-dependent oxidoreductase
LANASECIPLKRRLPTALAACLIVNPLTAIGLLDTARHGKHKAAIHTAGASQLGRMLLALAKQVNYPMIHVVRRDAQVELLRSLGAEYVLDSSDPRFPDRLEAECEKLNATIAFEAVAGSMTGTVANAMPPDSTVYVYGDLSEEPCGNINAIEVIFRGKEIRGFFLGQWIDRQGVLGTYRAARRAQQMLIDGVITTQIQRRLSLDEATEGLQQYVDHMTEGKVLIVPHD